MKHLALAWLSLTPFMSWGVTPEEQQLQQRLEEIRQQLILQNRALHEVQAQLDSSRAANGSAEGGNAAAEPTRRSADPGRSTEDLLLEEHNVFNRQWMIDFGVTYQHYDRKDLALRGFLALDAIFLGEINLDRVRSDQWIADLTTRYTLSDRWQLELQLPYVMRYSRYQSTGKENASTALEEAKVNGSDLGDMSLAVYYRLMMEDGRWPDLVWNLRGKVPSGKDPYGIEVDYSPSGNLITPQELATGDGVWQLSTGFSAVKTLDPAILFASVNYGTSFKKSFDDISYQPGNQPGQVRLGDWFSYGMGVAFALNERFSLSFSIDQRISQKAEQGFDGMPMEKVIGSDGNSASFGMGTTWAMTDNLSLALNWSVGLTEDAPDFTLGMRLPYRF